MALLEPGQPVKRWLLGPANLYSVIVKLRMWLYRREWLRSSRLPCRVISVGNMTVGGTGKTPVVMLLVKWLQEDGQRVAVLSRGYKRAGSDAHLLVSDGTRLLAGPSESGDEPFLIARNCPQAIVAVGSDRSALGRWVLEQFPVDCIILDDGFQHLALQRDVDLVLLDATDATGLDAMVPAGRLREPLGGLRRATGIMVTRAESEDEVNAIRSRLRVHAGTVTDPFEAVLRPEVLVAVTSGERRPVDWCRGKRAWLLCGVGNSGSFIRTATSLGIAVAGRSMFADHHCYVSAEIDTIKQQAKAAGVDLVLTTEKDAGKLESLLAPEDDWWAVRIRAEVRKGEAALRRLVSVHSREATETRA